MKYPQINLYNMTSVIDYKKLIEIQSSTFNGNKKLEDEKAITKVKKMGVRRHDKRK